MDRIFCNQMEIDMDENYVPEFKVWTGSVMLQPKTIHIIQHEVLTGITVGQLEARVYLQYIGLKDKTGKKIFNRDILLFESEDKAEPDGISRTYNDVFFVNGAFCWRGEITGLPISFVDDAYHLDCTVVGNMFQNPELLDLNNKED